MWNANREVAIVGVGETDFGALYAKADTPRDLFALGAEAFKLALDDAGLTKSDVDGLLCSRVGYHRMADVLGLKELRFVNVLEGAGRMSGISLQYAALVVASGLADTVVCLYSNNGRSSAAKYGGENDRPTSGYDAAYGMTSPGAYVSMMYRRYAQMYGAPEDALAPIAINNRRHAALNPGAAMKSEITLDQYMNSRFVAEPLRLYDYCIINDGAVAMVVTTLDRARDLRHRPVKLAATAARGDLTNFYTSQDFFDGACRKVAGAMYEQSGIRAADVDCLQIYDNFTPVVLFSLEGFGVAPRGEGWRFVRDTDISFTGTCPINTSGGHTGESYMQGWALQVEAVRQIRGQCGPRQVSDCHTAQYICASPIVVSHVLQGG